MTKKDNDVVNKLSWQIYQIAKLILFIPHRNNNKYSAMLVKYVFKFYN